MKSANQPKCAATSSAGIDATGTFK
jgi:hypothetical protein